MHQIHRGEFTQRTRHCSGPRGSEGSAWRWRTAFLTQLPPLQAEYLEYVVDHELSQIRRFSVAWVSAIESNKILARSGRFGCSCAYEYDCARVINNSRTQNCIPRARSQLLSCPSAICSHESKRATVQRVSNSRQHLCASAVTLTGASGQHTQKRA